MRGAGRLHATIAMMRGCAPSTSGRVGDPYQLAVEELADTQFRELAPEAGILDAAEGQSWRIGEAGVDVDHAGVDLGRDLPGMLYIRVEDVAAQAVLGGVGEPDRLLFAVNDIEGEHRT